MSEEYTDWIIPRLVPENEWHNVKSYIMKASGEEVEKIIFEWWSDISFKPGEYHPPIEVLNSDAPTIIKVVISQSIAEYEFSMFGMSGFLWQNLSNWPKFLNTLKIGYELFGLQNQVQLLDEVTLFCEETEKDYRSILKEAKKIEDDQEWDLFVESHIKLLPDHLSPVLGLESGTTQNRYTWLQKNRSIVLEAIQV
ncbi:hypothetical protein OO007_12880 [Cocleimonas sp. KMM 6892]|uniref:hypothetical protein n=1 Tax=unclassified Cocleimonas TaxID=2639732 RepID=UPI002DB7327E|nr:MULTISPECIES: hypothetical protein [unclassified Cocleimonas]MEB8433125.1 hypothetical protein [Cocleimonas sp. KMM 6892]MEC4715894.1 hypothetical protein [Cocleimonas sp. KMM 6895]MEC4745355.1 hypothetical protein [Cocleimonas sp. KMM 6896]